MNATRSPAPAGSRRGGRVDISEYLAVDAVRSGESGKDAHDTRPGHGDKGQQDAPTRGRSACAAAPCSF